jgi:Uma2 family endonuclease
LVQRALEKAFGANHVVRVQGPLDLGERSQPEPDVAVVAGSPRDYRDHPTSALLVVEISDTTLEFDRERKARLYAKAGLVEYWVVNLVDRVLEVHRSPATDAQAPRYGEIKSVAAGEMVSPVAAPTAAIAVSDLLP